jgi:hypothetical protein
MSRTGLVSPSAPGVAAAGLALLAAVFLVSLGLCGLPATAVAQTPSAAQVPASSVPASAASRPASSVPASAASGPASSVPASAASRPASRAASSAKANGKHVTKPVWGQLTPAQQQALAPLAVTWNTLSEVQKRKWLALSQNFPGMSGAEQAKLHSRMSDWVALSPQQRTQARLNFGETKQLAPDDKKAKWEAYQALPPEEKRKLAASAAKPPATAPALKPVPPEKRAEVPKPKPVTKSPRIAAAPGQIDQNTLLPQRAPAPASAN